MAILAYDEQTGKITDASAIDTVDKILEMKKTKDPWEVVDQLVQIWYAKSPEEAQGVLVQVEDLKDTRKDQTFAETDDKNMNRRLIVLFPLALQALIRKVYTVEELPFNKPFFREFAKRYQAFQIPEKL